MTIAVLAKLAGQSRLEALADWAHQRAPELARFFGLSRLTMPHHSIWSRILGEAVDVRALEGVLAHFFQASQRQAAVPARGSIVVAIDGKTVRGTIPKGATQGLHLMAAYLPAQGVVLAQLAVDTKTNEIVAAPVVLAQLDLTGEEERYGITSLPRTVASAEQVLAIARQEWGIENGLHYGRDVTLHEDAGRLRRGDGPQVLAALNNAVVGIVIQQGYTNLAHAQRAFDYPFDRFLARLAGT